ncbi:hypothetical protein HDU87_003728 [Geranomyces variabilis]|uniref:C2H2-type domain-containing protein n=1 Tax=Geranomyces variabilis TaxID=109894 RepID=A0AAD5TJI3_9FUNG|nr:hypothetical protein HDU87_003728 [Geranomyces variabilis]
MDIANLMCSESDKASLLERKGSRDSPGSASPPAGLPDAPRQSPLRHGAFQDTIATAVSATSQSTGPPSLRFKNAKSLSDGHFARPALPASQAAIPPWLAPAHSDNFYGHSLSAVGNQRKTSASTQQHLPAPLDTSTARLHQHQQQTAFVNGWPAYYPSPSPDRYAEQMGSIAQGFHAYPHAAGPPYANLMSDTTRLPAGGAHSSYGPSNSRQQQQQHHQHQATYDAGRRYSMPASVGHHGSLGADWFRQPPLQPRSADARAQQEQHHPQRVTNAPQAQHASPPFPRPANIDRRTSLASSLQQPIHKNLPGAAVPSSSSSSSSLPSSSSLSPSLLSSLASASRPSYHLPQHYQAQALHRRDLPVTTTTRRHSEDRPVSSSQRAARAGPFSAGPLDARESVAEAPHSDDAGTLSPEPETSYPPSPTHSDGSYSAGATNQRDSHARRGSDAAAMNHHDHSDSHEDASDPDADADSHFHRIVAMATIEFHQTGKIKCPSCHKDFSRLCNFRSHFRIHQVIRPFICNVCNQQFLRKHDLNRHERIHAGIKPFRCDRCGKGFVRKDALRRHENMVPDIQKFRCVAK